MPQAPLSVDTAINPSNQRVPLKVDASGNLLTKPASGSGEAVTVADGADVAQGAVADVAWASGNGTTIGLLKAVATALNKLIFGAAGSLLVAFGINRTLNVTAAAIIKAAAGRAVRIIILDPGTTGGAFTLNDCATTGAATTANQLWTLPYNGAANVAGTVFALDVPVTTGLVISAVPTGGTPRVVIVWN